MKDDVASLTNEKLKVCKEGEKADSTSLLA